jgi:hypothetical protein
LKRRAGRWQNARRLNLVLALITLRGHGEAHEARYAFTHPSAPLWPARLRVGGWLPAAVPGEGGRVEEGGYPQVMTSWGGYVPVRLE